MKQKREAKKKKNDRFYGGRSFVPQAGFPMRDRRKRREGEEMRHTIEEILDELEEEGGE